ncbi:hypothetical protein AD44_4987 [Escherichia coli 3-373-03_S4_C3]|nr:hypothetical protein AD17_4795 [Escherichia coli 3-373-03_S4_C2]KDU49169.1 hypothetical protein AC89_5027 [Escherichia coli 3-373-03_S4_C1]KEL20837.1 hypothetical protein AD44_4987 [Escherichia coli 3-373-03_S4_C3]
MKTMTWDDDYISIMTKPDDLTAAKTLRKRSDTIANGPCIVLWIASRRRSN